MGLAACRRLNDESRRGRAGGHRTRSIEMPPVGVTIPAVPNAGNLHWAQRASKAIVVPGTGPRDSAFCRQGRKRRDYSQYFLYILNSVFYLELWFCLEGVKAVRTVSCFSLKPSCSESIWSQGEWRAENPPVEIDFQTCPKCFSSRPRVGWRASGGLRRS